MPLSTQSPQAQGTSAFEAPNCFHKAYWLVASLTLLVEEAQISTELSGL